MARTPEGARTAYFKVRAAQLGQCTTDSNPRRTAKAETQLKVRVLNESKTLLSNFQTSRLVKVRIKATHPSFAVGLFPVDCRCLFNQATCCRTLVGRGSKLIEFEWLDFLEKTTYQPDTTRKRVRDEAMVDRGSSTPVGVVVQILIYVMLILVAYTAVLINIKINGSTPTARLS